MLLLSLLLLAGYEYCFGSAVRRLVNFYQEKHAVEENFSKRVTQNLFASSKKPLTLELHIK